MFDSLKAAIQDLLHGNVAPGDRRAAIADMKRALVSAKLGVEDLKTGVEQTRRKLETEREQLSIMQRRKALAEGISDAETVTLATRYEQQHAERVAVLERKLEAQEAEASLAERELQEMMIQLKAASTGAGSGAPPPGPTNDELGLRDDSRLRSDLDDIARRRSRADADAAAEARLAELKKKMGQ